MFGVALACGGVWGEDFVEAGQVVLRQIYLVRGGVFFQILSAFRARDGDDVVSLCQDPSQGELRRLAAFFFGEFFDFADQVEILLEVLSLKARRVAAVVVGGEIFEALELSGEESAAERAIGDEADAELAAGVEDSVEFGVACPERIFSLQRGDGMDLHRATKSVGAGFGEAEVTDFAFVNEFGHGSDGVFDGRVGVDAVLIVKVDGLDAEAAQAGFAGLPDVIGLAADTTDVGILGIADDAEFCGESDIVTAALDGASDEFFIFVRTVDVGGIEKEDAEIEGAVDRGDGFGVIAGTIKFRHAHAAETLSGDF